MDSAPEATAEQVSPAARFVRALAPAVTAYGWVYFSRRAAAGLPFLAATWVVPAHGLVGLAGAASAHGWAWALGRSREQLREGYDAFNGLLIGLALAMQFRPSLPLMTLLLAATLLGALLAGALRALSERTLSVPVLSLPFVLATWGALLAARRFGGIEPTIDSVLAGGLWAGVLPAPVELYVRSLGAAFFQVSVPSGLLVFVGLLASSRWATLLSLIGWIAGSATHALLGGPPGDLTQAYVGFNFCLTAIAVGGYFVVLHPASLVLAAVGAALSAVVTAGLLSALEPLHLPVLALPFIASTQLVLLAVGLGAHPKALQVVPGDWDSPERNLERARYVARRYPLPGEPTFYLPVHGEWLITQGPGDGPTHLGPWSDAWDFEVADEQGATHGGEGRELTDYAAYGAPVVAPAEGKVVRVVAHLADTPVGEVDAAHNWGNLVVIWHGGAVYSALCHLQRGSIAVREGEHVGPGHLLGRVGSSGRSPVPHLHLQLQRAAAIGAPTLPGSLLHYLRAHEGALRYETCGRPRRGERVRALEVDAAVRRAASLAPGQRWRWAVRAGQRTWEERWTSEIDALGRRSLVSDDGLARLALYADDRYLTLLDYRGPPGRLLGALYLGAPRVPFCSRPEVRWGDELSPGPFLASPARLLHELLLPFAQTARLRAESRLETRAAGLSVVTDLQLVSRLPLRIRLPERVEVTFAPEAGPVAIRAWTRGVETLTAEVLP